MFRRLMTSKGLNGMKRNFYVYFPLGYFRIHVSYRCHLATFKIRRYVQVKVQPAKAYVVMKNF
jgi:hypothetical protein